MHDSKTTNIELTFAVISEAAQFERVARSHRRSKIVVGVDQSPDAETVGHMISRAGYAFIPAANSMECLTLLSRIRPRLIILEIDLPELSGFEACKRIRAERTLDHVPIAFYTNRSTFDDVRESVDVGANDYILKSAGPGRLLSRVNHWTCTFVRPGHSSRIRSLRAEQSA